MPACAPARATPPASLNPSPPPPNLAAAYVKWGSADRQNFTEEEANQPLGLELWLRSLLPSADADSSSGGSGSSPMDAAAANGAGTAGEEGASTADARGKRKNE